MRKFNSDNKIRRASAHPTSNVSLRGNEERAFDCVYDPSYTVPSESEVFKARLSAVNANIPMNVYPKFDIMFENAPKSSRVDYLPKRQSLRRALKRDSTSSGLDRIHMIAGVGRLEGGSDNAPKDCKLTRQLTNLTSECKIEAPGMFLFQPCTNVSVVNVRLSDSKTDTAKFARTQCQYNFGEQKKKRMLIKTRGTQTLYRESSAQTLPYLPGVSNDEKQLESLEIFQLPTILPGDGPPGVYEVEVLERARKRWAFNKALKATFRRQMEQTKENLQPSQTTILEAFEWERWMEREEYIQECQMLRLEMVIRMFEAREKKMHQDSKSRIERSMDKIAAAREAGLRKNEIEHGRQLRRLDIKKRNQARCWRKENIASQFGSPSSEFYAPQMRYGVNPSRRHFVADRKAFEERMDDLEKKAVNMKHLVCPFAKLKRWSQPKSRLIEVEQNFCSDNNLKNLYESLKNLRQKSTKQKIVPKCLIEKAASGVVPLSSPAASISEESEQLIGPEEIRSSQDQAKNDRKEEEDRAFREQILESKRLRALLLQESHTEELEAMLAEYEGSTIGWMMKFLADESLRLQEQRKLHYLTMLAQRERWRREAAEAGLRQKENDLREIYEKLFHQTNDATIEVCAEYLRNALDVDTKDYAEYKAVNKITNLARTIDADIKRWLESFKAIQNPLNYETLRHVFKGLVFPDVNVLLKEYETQLVVGSMIEDVLFPEVDRLLEPILISNDIAEDMIDRLIDNDLYLFSDDSCSSGGDECSVQEKEARAIIRKLIRRSVPGRRWMKPAERTIGECVTDILDSVFENVQLVELKKRLEQEEIAREMKKNKKPRPYHSLNELRTQDSHINVNILEFSSPRDKLSKSESAAPTSEIFVGTQMLGNYREKDDTPPEIITRELTTSDSYHEMQVGTDWEYPQCPYEKHDFHVPHWYKDYVDSKKPAQTERRSDSSEYSQLDLIFREKSRAHSIRPTHSTVYLDTSSDEEIASTGEAGGLTGQVSKQIIADRIITEVIKSFVPPEGNEDMEEEAAEEEYAAMSLGAEEYSEEEFEDNPAGALRNIMEKVLENISDGGAEEDILEELDEEYELYINESEIELLESKRCKCKSEKERELFIREMLSKGKAKIIKKPIIKTEEQEIEEEHIEGLGPIEMYEYSEENEEILSETKSVTLDMQDDTAVIETINLTQVEESAQDDGNEAEETIEAVVVTASAELMLQDIPTENIAAIHDENVESAPLTEQAEATETVNIVEPVKPVEVDDTVEIIETLEPVKPVETLEAIETVEAVKTVEALETEEVVQTANVEVEETVETPAPIDVAASTNVVDNVQTVESVAPLDTQPIEDANDQEATHNEEAQVQEPVIQVEEDINPE